MPWAAAVAAALGATRARSMRDGRVSLWQGVPLYERTGHGGEAGVWNVEAQVGPGWDLDLDCTVKAML